ncbi:MAG: hypothetical protein ACI9DK_002604 [Vicingaceae bacterium]
MLLSLSTSQILPLLSKIAGTVAVQQFGGVILFAKVNLQFSGIPSNSDTFSFDGDFSFGLLVAEEYNIVAECGGFAF